MNEYTIVRSSDDEELAISVTNFLNQGWRCQGGVSHDKGHYIQAMVRRLR